MNDEDEKAYLQIGTMRLFDVEVYLDDILVYEGKVEDAPREVKILKYSKMKNGNKVMIYAYSKFNQ